MKIHGMTPQRWDLLCKHCGECCKLTDKNGIDYGYCQYLTWDINHKAHCSVYSTRLGRQITPEDFRCICVPIGEVFQRSLTCPYNLFFPDTPLMKLKKKLVK